MSQVQIILVSCKIFMTSFFFLVIKVYDYQTHFEKKLMRSISSLYGLEEIATVTGFFIDMCNLR